MSSLSHIKFSYIQGLSLSSLFHSIDLFVLTPVHQYVFLVVAFSCPSEHLFLAEIRHSHICVATANFQATGLFLPFVLRLYHASNGFFFVGVATCFIFHWFLHFQVCKWGRWSRSDFESQSSSSAPSVPSSCLLKDHIASLVLSAVV